MTYPYYYVDPSVGYTDSAFAIKWTDTTGVMDVSFELNGNGVWTTLAFNYPASSLGFSWTPASSLIAALESATARVQFVRKAGAGGATIAVDFFNVGLVVPPWVKPNVSDITVSEQTSSPPLATWFGAGNYVQNWSRFNPNLIASGAGGSSLVDSEVRLDYQTTKSLVPFGNPVNLSGVVPISGKVQDTRARWSDTFYDTVSVKAYNPPTHNTPKVTRTSDAAGAVPAGNGTYLSIEPSASVSSLNWGAGEKNLIEWQVRTRPIGGSWTTAQAWTNALTSGVTWTTKKVISGYAASVAYEVEVSVRDIFSKNGYSSPQVLSVLVPTESVFMDWADGGVGFGKYHTQGSVDAAGRIYQQNGESVRPVGEVTDFAGSTAPSGWLICNGAAVSRTTYADLFAYIGTTWGAGNGSTTFNVPNLQGRVRVGRDTGQAEFDNIGKLGGDKNMQQHDHPTLSTVGGPNLAVGGSSSTTAAAGSSFFVPSGTVANINVDVGDSGTGNSQNLQPYAVLLSCIKY